MIKLRKAVGYLVYIDWKINFNRRLYISIEKKQ